MWSVWDKKSDINSVTAEQFLDSIKFLQKETTIYIRTEGGRVTNVEGKSILADNFGIDPTLPDEAFIAAYEAKLAELEAEIPPPEEIPEEEPPADPETDTTTYAELAQVYAEGVNSIE